MISSLRMDVNTRSESALINRFSPCETEAASMFSRNPIVTSHSLQVFGKYLFFSISRLYNFMLICLTLLAVLAVYLI